MTAPASRPAARTPEGGYIGAPIPRREDALLLTGRGTVVDDLEMPGVAHAAMVRSPRTLLSADNMVRWHSAAVAPASAMPPGAGVRRAAAASEPGCPQGFVLASWDDVYSGVVSLGRGLRLIRDYRGVAIRLTDERVAHVLEHPEMEPLQTAIEEALAAPERVVTSAADPDAHLYYRFHRGTRAGDKYLCVVVKFPDQDAFVLTAYLTDKIKRGMPIWPETE